MLHVGRGVLILVINTQSQVDWIITLFWDPYIEDIFRHMTTKLGMVTRTYGRRVFITNGPLLLRTLRTIKFGTVTNPGKRYKVKIKYFPKSPHSLGP